MKKWILNELKNGTVGRILDTSYQSILDRIREDGYFQESLTGYYKGEFVRSAGACALLMLETERPELARKVLSFVFDAIATLDLPRIPHVIASDLSWTDMCDQIDGSAHMILGYARTCLQYPDEVFEEKYYAYCRKQIMSYYDCPHFYYLPEGNAAWGCHSLRLVLNMQYEHDREDRFWTCFDMIAQSFVGAAGDEMIKLAQRRGDQALEAYLVHRTAEHRKGVAQYMTFEENGKKLYLEMRLPDSHFGKPYPALGFTNYGPIVAGWDGVDQKILYDTLDYVEERVEVYDAASDTTIYMEEYLPDGSVDMQTYAKAIGWMIEYDRRKKDYEKIRQWILFLNHHHKEHDIVAEMFYQKDGQWVFRDYGNGEQCIWFCMMLFRLRRELEEEYDISH